MGTPCFSEGGPQTRTALGETGWGGSDRSHRVGTAKSLLGAAVPEGLLGRVLPAEERSLSQQPQKELFQCRGQLADTERYTPEQFLVRGRTGEPPHTEGAGGHRMGTRAPLAPTL